MSALQQAIQSPAKVFRRGVNYLVQTVTQVFRRIWPRRRRGGGDSPGLEEAGKPVPRKPSPPPHHLVSALALPPSDKTYLYPQD